MCIVSGVGGEWCVCVCGVSGVEGGEWWGGLGALGINMIITV